MPAKDGVEIYKRFYPWPERFRLGDPVLVQEVTGMRWPAFITALDEADEDEVDPVTMLGLIAVAFWQGNPIMSRDKVRRTMERTPQEEIEIISGDDGEADVGPPAEAAKDGGESPTNSTPSEESPEEPDASETSQDST